jgi:aspartyl-tRNA(Asn)/glutamyl-tRNA(Gln) amidotransferase subunit B
MQEGSFRCDANISLRPVGQTELGMRTELKNMNSFRHVQAALEYEVRRQRDLLLDGGKVVQQTLLWNPDTGRTEPMRGKEDAHDYRYFPCPDLVPIEISEQWIEEIRATLPELPDARKNRFIEEYGLPEYDAVILTGDRALAEYFEEAVRLGPDPKKVSNWIMTELMRELKGEEFASCPIAARQLGSLLLLVEKGAISGKIAKTVFQEMLTTGKDPEIIVTEKNLLQVSDEAEIMQVVVEILAANPEQVEELRAGKGKLMGFFVGQLMRRMKGKANPAMANELFNKAIWGENRP